MQLSSAEIENILLRGEPLLWSDAKTAQKRTIHLEFARQRRLLQVLLNSSIRNVRGISPTFVQSLKDAYLGGDDPITDASDSIPLHQGTQRSWILRKVEAYGFGGLTQSRDCTFEYELDRCGACIEGANGSGKSSFIGAITWALTGLRTTDQFGPTANHNTPQPVLNSSEQQIATWPPVAAYPADPADLAKPPKVGVRLTFRDEGSGQEVLCVRKIIGGKESLTIDPLLAETPGFLTMINIDVLMPCRLRHLRLGEKGTLSDAVQALTGLDRLNQLSDFVADLCNGNLDFRRYARRENQSAHNDSFQRSINAAEHHLPRNLLEFDRLRNLTSKELLNDLLAAKTLLASEASTHLKTLTEELKLPATLAERDELALAVRRSEEEIPNGLMSAPTVKGLAHITEALDAGMLEPLRYQVQRCRDELAEARLWRERHEKDSRLRLKIVAARWHHHFCPDDDEITICTLCDQALTERPELAAELTELRNKTEIAEQTFSQTCTKLETDIRYAWPDVAEFSRDLWGSLEPRTAIVADLRRALITAQTYVTQLPGIARRAGAWLSRVETEWPHLMVSMPAPSAAPEVPLQHAIAAAERLLALAEWWKAHRVAFANDWQALIREDLGQGSLESCLSKCKNALALAEPFQRAAAELESAYGAAKTWQTIEAEQQSRDAIADAITPLKDLRVYVQHSTALAINLLSAHIGEILRQIYLMDSLRYENTAITRNVVTVHGSFNDTYKINATLVANTSWLRAVLWAFIFALRREALSRFAGNPLPLMLLDDPQATFDPQHRRKWAQLISSLQGLTSSDSNITQFIITTHESGFVDALRVEEFHGVGGTICGVHPATGGRAIILDGRRLDQSWDSADKEKTPAAAQHYIREVRIEVETRLRLMLRGEAKDISQLIWGPLRELLESLHSKGIAPYDRSLMKKLLGHLSSSIKAVKLINWPHHFRDDDVGYAQAIDVEVFWRKTLNPILSDAFHLQREYAAMHGESSFQLAPRTSVKLPSGHEDILRKVPLIVRGQAAAMTDGRIADGRLSVHMGDLEGKIHLNSHSLFHLCAPTLEPVASQGDVLIVSQAAPVHPRNLVVVAFEDSVRARRFDLAETSPELAILISQAVNPNEMRPPIAVTRASIQPKKIVGVIYKAGKQEPSVSTNEVESLSAEEPIRSALKEVYGLYKVSGRSAEPFALDGQYLIVQLPSRDPARLTKSDGSLVIAIDDDGGHYFKRLRALDSELVVLESLDLTGREPSVLLGRSIGDRPALVEIIPVLGVLFEIPTT